MHWGRQRSRKRAAPDARPETWLRLDIAVEPQRRRHECWAAVASAVSRHYRGAGGLDQDAVVAAVGLPPNRFCDAGLALAAAGVLAGQRDEALTIVDLEREIAAGRIVVARIRWSFGGGHLVALSGLSSIGRVSLHDPRYGPSIWSHRDLVEGRYRTFGRWTGSYFTAGSSLIS
ncbi:hypothetical protein E2493_17200 [Sphingomonas parva]|uniref:Peptidase C39-like domain-containing protein n=1 Tax=Sphingomonas parva TaxID=2555898 RepID=A0A4Y8ZM01_9SPHN|nr:papain-like cysteine protease family protein [Sphingomonas parva]TFI57030.1 hypothetical protein E2493_17200 [Sphingomonas parva]